MQVKSDQVKLVRGVHCDVVASADNVTATSFDLAATGSTHLPHTPCSLCLRVGHLLSQVVQVEHVAEAARNLQQGRELSKTAPVSNLASFKT
jgi:hypothetical protein